jgi:phosphatidylglycerophosphatase A
MLTSQGKEGNSNCWKDNDHIIDLRKKRGVLKDKILKVVLTGFGSGFVPFAPGSAGAAAGIPVYLALSFLRWPYYLTALIVVTCLACYVCHEAKRIFDEDDPPCVVVDEIVGFLWVMFLVEPTLLRVIWGYILFRFFDIGKIFPANYIQSKLRGGYAIVMDDVVAGIYGNIFLSIMMRFGKL